MFQHEIPQPLSMLRLFLLIFCLLRPLYAGKGEEISSYYEMWDQPQKVTLEKLTEPPTQILFPMTVITKADIQNFGYSTLGEALNSVSGIFTGHDAQFDQYFFRGVGTPDDYNTRILILIDGHSVNEMVGHSSLDVGEHIMVPMESIEKIEVMKGPDSVSYGTSALLGVINITTKAGSEEKKTVITSNYGSFGTRQLTVSTGNVFLDNNGEFFVSASSKKSKGDSLFFDGLPALEGGRFDSDHRQDTQTFAKIRFKKLELEIAASKHFKNIGGGAFDSVANSDENTYFEKRKFINCSYSFFEGETWDLTWKGYWNQYQFLDKYDYGAPENDWFDSLKSSGIGSELLMSNNFWETHHVIFGIEWEDAKANIESGLAMDPENPLVSISKRPAVDRAFVKYQYSFRDNWKAISGIQYNNDHLFDKGFIYRAGLIWHSTPFLHWKLSGSQGFRSPSVYEAFYAFGDNSIPNPDLKRELATHVELVCEQILSSQWQSSFSVYRTHVSDLIVNLEIPENSAETEFQLYQNKLSFENEGIEGRLFFKNEAGVQLSFNTAYQQSKQWLVNFPQWITGFKAQYDFSYSLTFTGACSYIGRRRTRELDSFLSPYYMANVGIRYHFPRDHFEVWVGIKNLTDQTITSSLSGDFVSLRAPFRGREYALQATYRW